MPPKRAATGTATGRKKPNAAALFEMAEPFANGTVLSDLCHKTWTIGNPIGQGGFGCLYECRSTNVKTISYVVKVEPDSNGPLFCEMHFYLQLGKKTLQETFLKANRLDHLGVPQLVTHGMHQSTTSKRRYRFLVIPRYKQTLAEELRSATNRALDEKRVRSIGKQILDIFEYIHSHGYVHADIKAENIMMNDDIHIYLLDFGLSRKASPQYEEKVQRKHEGTLEFTSLDVHRGASPSFRGDLEILLYNILHWLGGQLPWINITDPVRVQQGKQTARSDPSGFIRNLFNDKNKISAKMLDSLIQYFREIISMNYTDQGDYHRLRDILGGQIRQRRSSIGAVPSRRPLVEMANDDDDDDDDEESNNKDDVNNQNQSKNKKTKRTSPRRSATNLNSTTNRVRSESRERRKVRNEPRRSRSPSPPIQMLSARTPALNMLNKLTKPTVSRHEIEDDENDIDMSAILNPKLSSTRIERPRRAPRVPVTASPRIPVQENILPIRKVIEPPILKSNPIPIEIKSDNERPHSDIIEKVLAGIPLSDSDIRKVIQRKK